MPPEDRVGLNDDEGAAPAGPQVTEPRPEQPVDWPQAQAPASLSLQDRQLMPQRGVLELERGPALQSRTERCEEDETDGHSRPGAGCPRTKKSIRDMPGYTGILGIHIAQVTPRCCGVSSTPATLNQLLVGDRLKGHGLLHETKEELAAVPGPTAVEAERELVEVGVQMRPTHPPVMGPKQPALEQRDDPVDPREQLGGQGVVSPRKCVTRW